MAATRAAAQWWRFVGSWLTPLAIGVDLGLCEQIGGAVGFVLAGAAASLDVANCDAVDDDIARRRETNVGRDRAGRRHRNLAHDHLRRETRPPRRSVTAAQSACQRAV